MRQCCSRVDAFRWLNQSRAEELFRKLCASPSYHQPALRSLLDIYIRERDWARAIDTATELQALSGVPVRKEIAKQGAHAPAPAVIPNDQRALTTKRQPVVAEVTDRSYRNIAR